MVYPKDEVVHKNLSTAFIDLPALLSTLKAEEFSGTLEVKFPKNRGTFLILSGNVINAQAWMGMLKDLAGEREAALGHYREALRYDTGLTMRHDQYGILIDTAWIEQRLAAPFRWK
ncbi:MAG: DUF4388 domain-containing protein [Syntrophobacteraceae bacterium]|nr:DUF4388 domain-containing protein [Syntrophobacteraceae bacterium]